VSKLNSHLYPTSCRPCRTSHRQTRGARDRAATHTGRSAGTGFAGLDAVRGRRRHRHHLQPRAQDSQHLLHQHRLRPVREEPLPCPAHQHHEEQPRHVHTGPGQRPQASLTGLHICNVEAWFLGISILLSNKNHFSYCFNNHNLVQVRFVKNVTEWREMKPAFYHGHVSFLDFTK